MSLTSCADATAAEGAVVRRTSVMRWSDVLAGGSFGTGCCWMLRYPARGGQLGCEKEKRRAAGCRFGTTGGRPGVGVGIGKLYAQVGRDHSHMHLCY